MFNRSFQLDAKTYQPGQILYGKTHIVSPNICSLLIRSKGVPREMCLIYPKLLVCELAFAASGK